jgi:vacuolar-type H+-ATPase catalytic subunit A/Vma1
LTPTFRANYILRGVMVPAGNHKVEWRFEPTSIETASIFGTFGSFSLLGACLLIFGLAFKNAMPTESDQNIKN